MYAAGLGYHEILINGEKIGNAYLDPAHTDYSKSVEYVFYPEIEKATREYKVGELFRDLPSIQAGGGTVGPVSTKHYTGSYLYDSGIKEHNKAPVTFHQARPNTAQDLEIYKIVVKTWNKSRRDVVQSGNAAAYEK